jgi:hypothetical protein
VRAFCFFVDIDSISILFVGVFGPSPTDFLLTAEIRVQLDLKLPQLKSAGIGLEISCITGVLGIALKGQLGLEVIFPICRMSIIDIIDIIDIIFDFRHRR